MAICLLMITLLHRTVWGPSIYCMKFQGWMRKTFEMQADKKYPSIYYIPYLLVLLMLRSHDDTDLQTLFRINPTLKLEIGQRYKDVKNEDMNC